MFDKLLVNFTWWVNREKADGTSLFEGGFMGLDNIGPIDRSHLPPGWTLEQADSTGWMAGYAAAMATIAAVAASLRAAARAGSGADVPGALRAASATRSTAPSLWDEQDGLFYDRLTAARRRAAPVRVRSMVSMIPMLAGGVVDEEALGQSLALGKRFAHFLERLGVAGAEPLADRRPAARRHPGGAACCSASCEPSRARRMCHGAARRGGVPLAARAALPVGAATATTRRTRPGRGAARVDYEPAESTTAMFGGNSNWRGPSGSR